MKLVVVTQQVDPADATLGATVAKLRALAERVDELVVLTDSASEGALPDNARVLRCLRGLARAVRPGGFLVYTNQPWHPQLEMIARVLVHGDGSPWVMRCRPQREMDDLVRSVGFEKVDMRTDKDGICSVSLARRLSPSPSGRGTG